MFVTKQPFPDATLFLCLPLGLGLILCLLQLGIDLSRSLQPTASYMTAGCGILLLGSFDFDKALLTNHGDGNPGRFVMISRGLMSSDYEP